LSNNILDPRQSACCIHQSPQPLRYTYLFVQSPAISRGVMGGAPIEAGGT